jgi:hypothetical protein
MTIRTEFSGMLPAAISKFEELLVAVEVLNPTIVKGYDSTAGKESFFYWGVACRMQTGDMASLKAAAQAIGITWLSDDGSMAYTNGLTINDFKTYRVNGDLELMPEKEI